ncbi:MAG: hypothetical protein GY913_02180 [Proteobacteria bacterium]|nr:hypothetical protein [Pseudomonadota bacterium]MCP4915707.1 hypothetical protein [Pseudomonadota bacterium]
MTGRARPPGRRRSVLVEPVEVEPEPESDCPTDPGVHRVEFAAGSIRADGWESASSAEGEADGAEAHSENVDAGEYLHASGFGACGEGRIQIVELGVRSRTQCDSGTYELDLVMDGGGMASTTFGSTTLGWTTLDLTADRNCTWDGVADVEATVGLGEHPGGARDSDAWVDAFRLEVTYVIDDEALVDTGESGDEDEPPVDTALEEDEEDRPDRRPRDLSEVGEDVSGCAVVPSPGGWLGLLLAGVVGGTRRRGSP